MEKMDMDKDRSVLISNICDWHSRMRTKTEDIASLAEDTVRRYYDAVKSGDSEKAAEAGRELERLAKAMKRSEAPLTRP